MELIYAERGSETKLELAFAQSEAPIHVQIDVLRPTSFSAYTFNWNYLNSSAPAANFFAPCFPESQLLHDSRFWSRPSTAFDQLFDRHNHHEQEVRFRRLCALDQAELLRAP